MWPFGNASVARDVRRRKIEWLLHSTHLTVNLPQIFEDGFIDTARGLRTRFGARAERLLHDPARLEKFSVGLDYINCSLTTPNFELLYARSKSAWPSEWVHFVLDIKLLDHIDTLYCPVSAAQNYGKHVQAGLVGFQSLFADDVDTWSRVGLNSSEPTHPQAEVLVKGLMSLASVTEIIVARGSIESEVLRLAEHYRRHIRTRVEPRLFIWPQRLKK